MAAVVVVPTKEEWEVVNAVLARCAEGGIIVSPNAAKEIEKKFKIKIPDGEVIDYDFGGSADVLLDIVFDDDQYVVPFIVKHVKESQSGEKP